MKNELLKELNHFYYFWRECDELYEAWSKKYNLTFNKVMIISSLYEDELCTQKNICEKWLIPKQTVNTFLKELESKKYIEFSSSKDDKRNKEIKLTSLGKEYVDGIITNLKEVEISTLKEMGIDKIKELTSSFEIYNSIFKKEASLENE